MTASPKPHTVSPPRVVVLVGRQNCGKTSIQMALTGADGRPVNFPGSSVERTEASMSLGGSDGTAKLVDLPGIGSLRPMSPDETLAIQYLREAAHKGAQLVVVLDATKLAAELDLLTELAVLGMSTVVAVNKADVAGGGVSAVDTDVLSEALGGVPVVATDARSGAGLDELRRAIAAGGGAIHEAKAVETLASSRLSDLADAVVAGASQSRTQTTTDRIDAIVMHPLLGLPLMAAVFFAVFQAIFVGADPMIGWIETGQGALSDAVSGWVSAGALQSFLVDGLIAGVGAVVIFVPQIAILMLLVAILEGSGYMARAAFILDRGLSRVGLNGRSFVPLLSSFACAVPGIASTRIIEHERDRIATMVVAPLMSCSARLPVYVVLIGAFFAPATAGLVLFSMYALGIVAAAAVAFVLRKTVLAGPRSPLLLELPVYQWPVWRVVGRQAWTSVKAFLALAGTLIFAASIVIWLLSYYPRPQEIHAGFQAQRASLTATANASSGNGTSDNDATKARLSALENQERAAYLEQSYLARMGKAVQPVFAPAGFDWRTTVGIVAAFPARELIVPTLGILYGLGDIDPGAYEASSLDEAPETVARDGLRKALVGARRPDGSPAFDWAVALSLMVFFALCSQCVATLGAIKRETRSWKWPTFTFVYMTVLAWVASVATYQISLALS